MSYDGKNLYLFNNGAGRATETKTRIQRYCYVLDTKGNQIAKILCNGVVYFGDTDYLFEENGDNLEYMKKENLSDNSVDFTTAGRTIIKIQKMLLKEHVKQKCRYVIKVLGGNHYGWKKSCTSIL